jgi:formyltetrahydrofolate-dependent phosphoribosylglycinamide formyltransferase
MMMKKRAVALISGRGSNMEALMAAATASDYPVEFVGVVSNRPEARGLSIARERGVETVAVPQRDHSDRAAHEEAVHAAIAGFAPDIVCLAGYMRILSPAFVARWRGRMINIHPSLLPAFPGLHTHRRALETGVRIHGCSVHFVTEVMDEGPIVAQAAVPVLADDDEDALSARVLAAEHILYPHALALVARGHARMEGDGVRFAGGDRDDPDARLIAPAPDRAGSGEPDLEYLARFTP